MYCTKCGKEVDDNAFVCPHCGCLIENKKSNYQDAKSGGFAFLCFLVPLLGLILYLVWKKDYPLKASSCGKGALIGVIVSVCFYILLFILRIAFVSAAAGAIVLPLM